MDETYFCYCQILELETGIRDLETKGVNWVLSNVKMCFCLLVELSVFVLFCTSSGNGSVFHQMLAFSWRGTKQTKKNKDFGLFRPRLRQDSKIFVFLVFSVPSHKMATFSTKSLHFPGGVPGTKTTKKDKDFGLFRPRLRQDSNFLVFFGFLVPPHKMATFSTKSLHFPGGVPNKPKKPKILDTSGLAFAKTLKSLFFFVFLVPPHKMATFSTKSLHFPGGVPGTKTTKKDKDVGLFRPRLRQDSKIFVFVWFFWYLLTKWQRFPPNACIFLEGYQKNKKRFWTLQASPLPRF